MSTSTSNDEAACDRESREFELDSKGEPANHYKRVRGSEKDLYKAHTLLWGRFRLTLCDTIEAQPGFEAAIRSSSIFCC